jgi:hypothetical protein
MIGPKLLLTLTIVQLSISYATAQSRVSFAIGGNYNQVRFRNSNGNLNEDLRGLPAVNVSLGYEHALEKVNTSNDSDPTNHIGLTLGYKSGQFKDKASHVLTTWTINYLSTSVDYFHRSGSKKPMHFMYGTGLVNDFLVSGVQSRGFEQYDLSQDLQKSNLSFALHSGLFYRISDFSQCALKVSYLKGLTNIEKDTSQSARLNAWQLSAIIFFDLSKRKNSK